MVHIRKKFRKFANIDGFIVKPGYYEVYDDEKDVVGYSSGWVGTKMSVLYCYFPTPVIGKWVGGWYIVNEDDRKNKGNLLKLS